MLAWYSKLRMDMSSIAEHASNLSGFHLFLDDDNYLVDIVFAVISNLR